MALTFQQVQALRESIYSYVDTPANAGLMTSLRVLDQKLVAGSVAQPDGTYKVNIDYSGIKGNAMMVAIFKKARDLSPPEHTGAWNQLLADVAGTAPAPTQPAPTVPTTPPTPPPATGTLRPLTPFEQGSLYLALEKGVNAGVLPRPFIDKIADDAVIGNYAYADKATVDGVKLWYYGGANAADQQAMSYYLSIVDQRDSNGNPLPPNDPRIKRVSGTPTAPGPVTTPPTPLPTQQGDQVFAGNVTILKKLAVGGPLIDAQPQIQITGGGSAEILCRTNTKRGNPQNQATDDVITFSGGWEGSAAITIGTYIKDSDGSTVWPNPNRKRTRVNVDSAGRFGISQERFGKGDELAQIVTIGIDHDRKLLLIDAMQGGWKVAVGTRSVTNGAPSEKVIAP